MDKQEPSAQGPHREPGDGMNLHHSEGREDRTNIANTDRLEEDPAEMERGSHGWRRKMEAERRETGGRCVSRSHAAGRSTKMRI